MKLDLEIRHDVEEELQWEPDLDATDVAVTGKNGVVSLTGYVQSYSEKF
jgi:osmotically-inducible protein OsmY